LIGHKGQVLSIDFHPLTDIIASSSEDKYYLYKKLFVLKILLIIKDQSYYET